MLRSFLLVLCFAWCISLSGQDTAPNGNISLKTQYGVRGHHSLRGLFHGAGLQVGVQMDESWSLLLQHSRYTHNQDNGRLRTVAIGAQYILSAPEDAVQFFATSSLALLSSRISSVSNFKTGWEMAGGFGAKKPLTPWLFVEAQALYSYGVIYGERIPFGDIVTDDNGSGVNVLSFQLGLGVQF